MQALRYRPHVLAVERLMAPNAIRTSGISAVVADTFRESVSAGLLRTIADFRTPQFKNNGS